MSVSAMKMLTVFAHANDSDAVIRKLMSLKCVQIEALDRDSSEELLPLARVSCDADRSALEASLARINDAINTLDRYTHRKKSLFKQKIRVSQDKFVADGYADKARFAVDSANSAVTRQNEIKNEINRLRAEALSAQPWVDYDLPLGMSGTRSTDTILGTLPAGSDLNVIGRELYEAGAVAEVVSSDSNGIYVALVCYKGDTEGVLRVLSGYAFTRLTFGGVNKSAKEYIAQIYKKISSLEEEYQAIENKLTAIADSIMAVEVLYDVEQTSLTAIQNKQKLLTTDSAVIISAWLPERCEERVCSALDKFECAYETEAPTEEDNPPILLENNAYARNFEWVLGM